MIYDDLALTLGNQIHAPKLRPFIVVCSVTSASNPLELTNGTADQIRHEKHAIFEVIVSANLMLYSVMIVSGSMNEKPLR